MKAIQKELGEEGSGVEFEELEEKIFVTKDYSMKDIKCRHKIKNEYFISANRKLWPCCHLHDEYVAKKTNDMNKILN